MAKKSKIQSPKSICLLNSENHSAVVSSLKRVFSRGPVVKDFLRKYRREEIWFKKDGTQAIKPKVFYKCWKCQQEFNSNKVQVDHIEPVIPINIPSRHLSYTVIIDRLFCDDSNLQILCKEHHKDKSDLENSLRKEWLVKTKYIVYETCNKTNNKKYIGVHKCTDYDDDEYLGSGKALKKAVEKYGKDKFYRQILFVFDNPDEAFEKERELVTDEIVASNNYYNLTTGGKGNFEGGSNNGRPIVHLNTRKVYPSITSAASDLSLNFKSLRNAMIVDDYLSHLDGHYFVYESDYDPSKQYPVINKKVLCVELNRAFNSYVEAAIFLGHKKPDFGGIAIGRAVRNKVKMYKYTWQSVEETTYL